MRVSTKSDYALRALIEIARHGDERPISAEQIGGLQDIPHTFLQAILGDLRKAGILVAQRGYAGGWRLAGPATQTSVADVIRAIDGPLLSVHGLRPEGVTYNDRASVLQHVWVAARSSLRQVLERVTVADLVDGGLPGELAHLTSADDAWHAR